MFKKVRLLLTQTVLLSLLLVLIMTIDSGLTRGERAAQHALDHLGKPYELNASGPEKFDCSGLVRYCYHLEGEELPHSAEAIGTSEAHLFIPAQWMLLPGDVLSFDTVSDNDPSDHVGIYLGGNQFVHASSAKHEVIISTLEDYYLERYTGARRIALSILR